MGRERFRTGWVWHCRVRLGLAAFAHPPVVSLPRFGRDTNALPDAASAAWPRLRSLSCAIPVARPQLRHPGCGTPVPQRQFRGPRRAIPAVRSTARDPSSATQIRRPGSATDCATQLGDPTRGLNRAVPRRRPGHGSPVPIPQRRSQSSRAIQAVRSRAGSQFREPNPPCRWAIRVPRPSSAARLRWRGGSILCRASDRAAGSSALSVAS